MKDITGADHAQIKGQCSAQCPPQHQLTPRVKCTDPCCHARAHVRTHKHTMKLIHNVLHKIITNTDDAISPPRDPPLFPLLSSLRAHTRTHHQPKCVGTGTNQSPNKHLSPVTSRTFCESTSAVSYGRSRGSAPVRVRACRSLSASPSIQQPPYSADPHIFIMKNANVLLGLNERAVRLLTPRWSPFHVQLKWVLILFSWQAFLIFLFLMTLSANHCQTIGRGAEPRAAVLGGK